TKLKFRAQFSGPKIEGPALVLSNHASNHDWKFILSACIPERVTFMATYHWFTFKFLGFFLKVARAIPKYQFATDLESMKKVRHIVQKEKGVVFIAPEGTVYSSGHLGEISPVIAKMIRFLKVPVYAIKIEGAGLGNAKWSKKTHKGKVAIERKLLLTQEESVSLSSEEIMGRLIDALNYNEFDFQKKNNIRILGNNKAEGFETMFYKCPICGNEFTISSKGNIISCSHCHSSATIKEDFTFKWNINNKHKPLWEKEFENYSQWYDWQYEKMYEEVSQPHFCLKAPVEYGIDEEGVNNYVKVGKGTMILDHTGWLYEGTFKDTKVKEFDEAPSVFLATLKIGLHFELPYRFEHCRVFYPENGLESMKWHLASIAMREYLENNHS
ncbi:MAG: 1-acyl-sn-glycerol-3-phosphate acyltransferase, partial [Sphaerochaetaceae bacterium]|nr:1-acyl-sn-glycerol-3-phosphate acyltransferase [Sphaerochaetaceae bacterium]